MNVLAWELLNLIPKNSNSAQTAKEIGKRFLEEHPESQVIQPQSRDRKVRRYLNVLYDSHLIEIVQDSKPPRYFVSGRATREFPVSRDDALKLLWSQKTIKPLMPMLSGNEASLKAVDRVLQERIRIVPDGIGREDAVIKDEHLKTVVTALRLNRMIDITYGKKGSTSRNHQVSILGLAVKDGTIYLIASESMTGAPRHFPMHRIKSLDLLLTQAHQRPDFDLDQYIADQYQLSHKLDSTAPPSKLELLVHKDALFHFEERPLLNQEPIDKAEVIDGVWYRVYATVPDTVQLTPFLCSHAGWVQVLAPAAIRGEVAKRLHAGARHYPPPDLAEPR